jgi:CubicO group peptidase (beta-lactamase class C family)
MKRMVMGITLTAIAALGFLSSGGQAVDQRIRRVENGLWEAKAGAQGLKVQQARASLIERMKLYKNPGVSIAIIQNDKIEWAKAYGVLRAGDPARLTVDSLFEAASTSKLVTAAIALRFVDEGKLALDEDVNKSLKSWKVPGNEFTREKKVTLRLLLTHQAGLPMTNYDAAPGTGYPTLLQVLKGELPAKNKPAVVEFVPGSKWQYSNVGYDVVQLLLEDTAGKPFAEIAKEVVFDPLGMGSSTFVYPLPSEMRRREAMPHDENGLPGKPGMHLTAQAHGGLMTTPPDLARFTISLMTACQGQSGGWLSPAAARQLLRKELDLDPRMFGFSIAEGLGVMLLGSEPDVSFLHPGSNLPGTNCWLEGCPGSGQGAVIMTNGAGGELLAIEIRAAIAHEYGWPIGPSFTPKGRDGGRPSDR